MAQFANGEKVLCFHGSLMYEAKCLRSKILEDNHIRYRIHYIGWHKNWDEWVPGSRVFKYNDANVQRQKKLFSAHNEQPEQSKRKSDENGEMEMGVNETNKNYTCTSCIKAFPSQSNLDKHMKWHTLQSEHEADITMDENETRQKHWCTLCTKMFYTQTDFDKHWQWHVIQLEHMQSCCVELNQIKIFKCDFCTSCFLDVAELNEHQNKYFKRKKNGVVHETRPENNKTFSLESDLERHTDVHILQTEPEADINMDENLKNKIDTNKINKTDDNDTNKIEGKETNKIVYNETIKIDESETIKIDESETNRIDENETSRIDENATSNTDESKTYNMDENEANDIYITVAIDTDNNATKKIDISETNNLDENETNQIDENETSKVDENETNNIDANKTNKVNENETNKIDGNETNDIQVNESDIIDTNETYKTDENEINKRDETNNRNENITKKFAENETSQKYSCIFCIKTFSGQSQLNKHCEVHTVQLEYMKNCCVKLHQAKIFKCEFCTSCYPDLEKLRIHQKKYFQKDISTSHTNNNPTGKRFECETCGWGFVKRSTLEAHSILHEPYPHMCECGIGYYQKRDLDAHRELVHPNYKPPKPSLLNIKKEAEPASKSNQLKPQNKLGPRLKATLIFKQPKNKTNKLKRLQRESIKRENPIKSRVRRIKSEIKMELETDENGNYACPICAQTFIETTDLMTHLYTFHTQSDAGRYKCEICGKTSLHASNLKMHMVRHAGLKPYVCHICNGRFSQGGALTLHLKRHTGDKQFNCKECDKSFYNGAALLLHSRVHTREKPYECKKCGKSFSDPSAYRRHLIIHTGLKPYKCQTCPKAFCDPAALFRHNRMHAGFRATCSKCKKIFCSNESLGKHMIVAHTRLREDEKFECDHCSKRFALKSYLVLHMKHSHFQSPAVQCEICCKMYTNAENLKHHVHAVHLRMTRFECKICGARFLYNHQLKRHKNSVHRSKVFDKPFECDHCHKSYYSKFHLLQHIIKTHLGIVCRVCTKTFPTSLRLKQHKSEGCRRCTICNKAFSTPKQLKEHFIVNHLPRSEQQLFVCDYCGREFPIKTRLQRHIKLKHMRPKFRCDQCNEAFAYRKSIVDHIWEKHMVSLYCNICLKRFYRECEFLQHKRSANCRRQEIPCEICDKKFPSMWLLRNHLLYHAPKRMECDMCGDKFTEKKNLARHIKLVHKPKDQSNGP